MFFPLKYNLFRFRKYFFYKGNLYKFANRP